MDHLFIKKPPFVKRIEISKLKSIKKRAVNLTNKKLKPKAELKQIITTRVNTNLLTVLALFLRNAKIKSILLKYKLCNIKKI
jgi:hypothetical protein